MKCMAEAVRKNERYNFQHRKYGELFLDFTQTAAVYAAAAEYKSLRDPREIQKMLDDTSDWMIDGVTRAIPDNMRMRDGGRRWWACETEREDDAIQTALFRWERDFRYFGFRDRFLTDLEPGPYPEYDGSKYVRPEVLQARAARIEYMTVRGRDAVRLFTFIFFCWLAEQARGEKARFSVERIDERVYPVYAAEVRTFEERFVEGDKASMNRIKARLAHLKKALSEWGIVLADVGDASGETEKEPAGKDNRRSAKGELRPEAVKAFEQFMKKPEGFGSLLKFAGKAKV